MKRKMSFAFAGLLALSPALIAQESQEQDTIVIINKDGEEVKTEKAELVIGEKNPAKGRVKAQIKGDKIIIVDANGKTREIDIAGAKSVSVQQSVQSVEENGEQSTITRGKAIVIGPDGERHEIELDGPILLNNGDNANMFLFRDGMELPKMTFPNEFQFRKGFPGEIVVNSQQGGKFAIGVVCKPVPESLRAHLELEPEVGLLVESVIPDQPAEKAGLQKHDILVYADDSELGSNEDLVAVIQEAGKSEDKISVTAVRRGKEVTIKIKPAERKNQTQMPMAFEFRELGPGIILGDDIPAPRIPPMPNLENMQQRMEQQLQRMRKQMEMLERQMDRFPNPGERAKPPANEDDGEDT